MSRFKRLVMMMMVVMIAAGAALSTQAVAMPARSEAAVGWLSAARDVTLARLGEEPALSPHPYDGHVILCEDLSPSRARALDSGVAMMRATETGRELFEMLQEEGVCIGLEELDYNSAYASARWSPVNGWANSEIRIDTSLATYLYPDVLAAILIHEATHMQRAIERTACYYADSCTVLTNGVYLDEEVVAHSAEAEFWIELFGRDGKDLAFATDSAENQLKSHFLQGPAPFQTFVRDMRSDAREGEGF